ncbi:hypothetical protein EV356DRAFT_539247 [Viridothelium virens]|uniref:Transcriptional co-activator n=1 Tax=Viridothelium virens TaxID=1048519 RepID=A0A6A6HGW7_VIRVR|nr:hypothetical protein EV356DRAFT_539247 [Viridothelium virens]
MNPADLQRTDSISHHGPSTPLLASTSLPTPTTRPTEPEKKKAPRVDIEPIYTALKQGIGEGWSKYKEAISDFVQGHLTPAELNTTLNPLLSQPTPSQSLDLSRLHNQLLIGLYANLSRDPPESSGPAPFVSANDHPSTTLPKGGTSGSDATEARIKSEVMHLQARERHRIKTAAPSSPTSHSDPLLSPSDPFQTRMNAYTSSRTINLPTTTTSTSSSSSAPTAPTSTTTAGSKTNLEGEIKKRYLQPLSSETLEFPDADALLPRLGPMCYECGLAAAPAQEAVCAEYLAAAAETYIKEALTSFFARVRSDGEPYVQTAAFRRRRRREEAAAWRGEVTRGKEGLLPVEMEAAGRRRPLGMQDLRLALQVGDPWLGQVPLVAGRIVAGLWAEEEEGKSAAEMVVVGGKGVDADGDVGMGDREVGWNGGAVEDRGHLDGLLEDFLAVGL